MKDGLRFSIAGMILLLLLASCGRGFLQYGERAPWRSQAEMACLKSGSVKIGSGVVQIERIEGPGICGADFPLRVAALGENENSVSLSYADDLRPPSAISDVSPAQMPHWPVKESLYSSASMRPVETQPVQTRSMQNGTMRWITGPSGIQSSQSEAPSARPLSLRPPGIEPSDDAPDAAIVKRGPYAPQLQPLPDAPAYRAPPPQPYVPLGPARGPAAANIRVALTPAATLACPIVSALDRWVSESVQPAALHWFGAPVVTMQQISAYSCRGMVGAGTSTVSEHAFGNALDIAGFTLADGRKITVKDGWHGTPEEQGFLHDVQSYACETFTTVLAPGYNVYHDDHIHVDLMRRESGRRSCQPNAISGEVVAAKARAHYANQRRGPVHDTSIGARPFTSSPNAVAGADGYGADDDSEARATKISARQEDRRMRSY